ncbi:MAG: capsular biosynthesis protein [Eubacterium sp.]|nr:capsular biosynthesis protein [Eubacterium sp.]
MIDMHNHVLFGVDDGAQSLEDSVAMLDKAREVGFTGVVLTPHYMCYQNFTSPVAENEKRTAQLREVLRRIGLEMDIYLGSELLYEYKLGELIDTGAFKPLGDTKYFLVETIRHGGSEAGLMNFIQRLQTLGYQAIFAHPERYDFVQEDPNVLIDFMKKSCLIQSNYLSLTGYYGPRAKDTLKIMLEHDMVQLLGSDAHQVEGYALYPNAAAEGISVIGQEKWQQIVCTNPDILLKGERQLVPAPRAYSPSPVTGLTVIGNPMA